MYKMRYMITSDGRLFHHIDTFTGESYEDIMSKVMKKYPGATKENHGRSWILL